MKFSIFNLALTIASLFSVTTTAQHLTDSGSEVFEAPTDARYFKLGQNLDSFYTYTDKHGKERVVIMLPKYKKPNRVWTSSFIIAGASVASMGILYMMPEEMTRWNKDGLSFRVVSEQWHHNVSRPPVVDEDIFLFNYVMHPYFGSVYYETLRCAGYSWEASFLYSAAMSTLFWEYGFESIAERPSVQDLVITPVVGSLLGESLYLAKKAIKKKQDRIMGSLALGRFALFLIDPLNEIQDVSWRHYLKKHPHSASELKLKFSMVQNRPGFALSYHF